MQTILRKKVAKNKFGKITGPEDRLEPHERKTVRRLASFGFDAEILIPSNIPKSRNPDLLMMGTIWEMKGPTSFNEDTIKKRFRRAIKQANGKGIFDLNSMSSTDDSIKAEEHIIKLFKESRSMRRIMIIRKSENLMHKFKHILDSPSSIS